MPERLVSPQEITDAPPSIPPEICIGLLSRLILTDQSHRPSRDRKLLPPRPTSAWRQAPHTEQLTHLYGVQARKKPIR